MFSNRFKVQANQINYNYKIRRCSHQFWRRSCKLNTTTSPRPWDLMLNLNVMLKLSRGLHLLLIFFYFFFIIFLHISDFLFLLIFLIAEIEVTNNQLWLVPGFHFVPFLLDHNSQIMWSPLVTSVTTWK